MNKKIFYYAAFALGLLGFTSCEENDDFDPTYVMPNYFVGSWEHTQTGSLNSANILYYDDVVKEENCEFDNVVFNPNMTFSERDYSFDGTCNYTDANGIYQIVNGNIVLTLNGTEGETMTFDVIALTNTTLEVSYTDEDTDELVFLKFTKS